MDELQIPNTFITEDGTVIFYQVVEIPKKQLSILDACDNVRMLIEDKYKTTDIFEMMKLGASQSEIMRYLTSRHFLMTWGYE